MRKHDCVVPIDGVATNVDAILVEGKVTVGSRESYPTKDISPICEIKRLMIERAASEPEIGIQFPSDFYYEILLCAKCQMLLHNVQFRLNQPPTGFSDKDIDDFAQGWRDQN